MSIPVISMVGDDSYSLYLGTTLHAMVTYGVKYNAGTGEYYLISKDPNSNHSTNPDGARIEESIWDTYNDRNREHFGIYGVIYTSFY